MSRATIVMTIDDVDHYTPEQRKQIIDSYPAHERDARASGIPTLGSGRVFPVSAESITVAPFALPKHWPQIVGVDFGIDHPFAAVRHVWDRDADCIYVTHTYRVKDAIPVIHAASVLAWGKWLPVSWPHDGLTRDKGSGEQLATQYRSHGLNMLSERATHEAGGNGVEAGLTDILERMQTNRFKVFAGLNDWFEEFRMYHRKDGLVVAEHDDLMAASRYAVMMKRMAIIEPRVREIRQPRLGTIA